MLAHRLYQKGFTIVELLIVIVVIGILAGVVVVAYSGVTQSARQNALRSDLSHFSAAMQAYGAQNPLYPADCADVGIQAGDGKTLDCNIAVDQQSYCIGLSDESGNSYYATDTNDIAVEGTCDDIVTLPDAPTLTAGTTTSSGADLSWSAPADAISYVIEYDDDSGFGSSSQTTTSGTSTTLSGLSAYTPYYFRVAAVGSGGQGSWSSSQTATTKVGVPTGLSVVWGCGYVASWGSVSSATSYSLQYDDASNFATPVGTITPATSGSIFYPLTSGNHARVAAIGPNGQGDWSAVVPYSGAGVCGA